MSAQHSEYNRGEMAVEAQRHTFDGFMNGTIYGGSFLVLLLVFPILLFAVNLAWLPSLVITLVVGVVLGLALKLKGGWYALIIGLGIVTGILCALLAAFI